LMLVRLVVGRTTLTDRKDALTVAVSDAEPAPGDQAPMVARILTSSDC
jgi:hypothetical protein